MVQIRMYPLAQQIRELNCKMRESPVRLQRWFYITKHPAFTEQLYLSDIILQLVVLLNVEACPFHPLVEEQQILPVSGVGINVLLQVTETRSQSCV